MVIMTIKKKTDSYAGMPGSNRALLVLKVHLFKIINVSMITVTEMST